MAVAEAWVASDRVPRYANPNSLGQSFNFDLLEADFEADQFRRIVSHNLEPGLKHRVPPARVLSNHDVVRHPTRYGLPNPARRPPRPAVKHGEEWLRGEKTHRYSIANAVCAVGGPPRCSSLDYLVPPTFIRARSWACTR